MAVWTVVVVGLRRLGAVAAGGVVPEDVRVHIGYAAGLVRLEVAVVVESAGRASPQGLPHSWTG